MRAPAVLALGWVLLLPAAGQARPIELESSANDPVQPGVHSFDLNLHTATLDPETPGATGPDSGPGGPARLLAGYYFPPPIDIPETGAALLLLIAAALGLVRRHSS